MKRLLSGKIWGLAAVMLLVFVSSASAQVGAGCVTPAPGCYCDDGPNGSVNCRIYGAETSGYWLDGAAGQGAVPALRTNLSYLSNTAPNVGEVECWDISNTSPTEYFIPTSTRNEWNSFKAAAIAGSFPGITMAKCPTCGDGVCSMAVTYWGFQESCGSDDSMTPAPETGDPQCNNDCGVCPIVCGDGFCAAGAEHCTGGAGAGYNPCVECGACSCGDAYYDCTGQCGTCPSCSPCCGDTICDAGENGTNCPADCAAAICGDLICNGVETACTCPGDCTTDVCGDGCCTGAETCGVDNTAPSCNSDCGACACTGAIPPNSSLCPGDDAGLTSDTPITTVDQASCTAGTMCEYFCDPYTKLVSGECRYCYDLSSAQSCFTFAPMCSSIADCPADLNDGCVTNGSQCRQAYTGDCSIDPCGTGYTCNNCNFNCTGAVPANSSVCAGDDVGLPMTTPLTLVGACTGGTKCEYICDVGYFLNAGACDPYICTGSVPSNSTLCAGDDTGLPSNLPNTVVDNGACTVTKCEYECDVGYFASAGACSPYICTGTAPSFSRLCCVDYDLDLICEPDDEGLLADTPITLVDACTQPTFCEYVCAPYYSRSGITCTPDYSCTGFNPANATLCPDDNISIPSNMPKTAVETGACTATKCEYECNAGHIVDGNDCRLPFCLAPQDPNATLCPGDDTGLAVDTPYTTVVACGPAFCETTCDSGYQVDGANSCRANVCTGADPANATLCAGDDSIPGNSDVPKAVAAACTGPTYCEYTCDVGYELDIPGTSCVIEIFDCTGTPDPNGTLCPGDDIGLLVDTPVTTVDVCTATMCEYQCNSGYHDTGVNQCSPNICIGAVPDVNSSICIGDDINIPGNGDVTRTLVGGCTAPTYCEYVCNSGFNYDAGICDPNICIGAVPDPNATLCVGDDTNIAGNADVTNTLVGTCTAPTYCEYECNDGYWFDAGVCSPNMCIGNVPTNATICPGDDSIPTGHGNVTRTVVTTCTAPQKCEFTCNDGYHDGGGVCDVNICTGAVPANATLCASDDLGIPGNSNIGRSVVGACTAPTFCEYTCDVGHTQDGATCRPFMCINPIDPNATLCPGDDTGLLVDTPRTTVAACGGPLCEYTCDSGYNDGGVNQCDANVCVGADPSNASLCLGDNINIPGNGDVVKTLASACTAPTKCEYTCDSEYHFNAGVCDVNICTGAVPINASLCTNDDINIPGNSNIVRDVVAACTAGTKCEYTCDDGWNFDGSSCINTNVCIGAVPPNATLCAGDDINIPGNDDIIRTVVTACTAGTKCEYTCDTEYHEDAGACIANVCIGAVPSPNSSVCPGDDVNIPGGMDVTRTLVIACTPGTKCEFDCDAGYSVDTGVCQPDGVWIKVNQVGEPTPFSPSCGGAFALYPGYIIDNNGACPSAYIGDTFDCWESNLRKTMQCHQVL